MSLLALVAASAAAPGTPVTATGPTWTDDAVAGGGTWTTPTQTGITYSPATGTATSSQTVTVTATAQPGYTLQGTSSWSHTFPAASAIPYTFPTTAPYNVPQKMVTSLGEVVHPSVVDFQTQHGQATWNGYRYWLAITPYPNGNSGAENPCIQASADGYTWVTPAGLTNPIDPPPGAVGYNSDTDLVYDPDSALLWCFWREHRHGGVGAGVYYLHAASSANGVTWTKHDEILSTEDATPPTVLSPCVVRVAAGQWKMLSASGPSWWTATAPTGPWTYASPVSFTWAGMAAQSVWHLGVTRFAGGTYRALLDINGPTTQAVFAASSTNGTAWNVAGAQPVIAEGAAGSWDRRPYRACLTPHENGTHARVWYSAGNSVSPPYQWYAGYTQIPLSEWPAPPA